MKIPISIRLLSSNYTIKKAPSVNKTNKAHLFSSRCVSGVSLMELLVTLCIISILCGFAAVSVGPLWKKHQLRLAVDDIISQIQLFRMKSILENRTYQIKFSQPHLYYCSKSNNQWSGWKQYKLKDQVFYSMSGTTYFYSKGFASPKTIP